MSKSGRRRKTAAASVLEVRRPSGGSSIACSTHDSALSLAYVPKQVRTDMLLDFIVHRGLVWIFRLGLFVGLLSAVVTVIYFTPVPSK